MELRLATAVVVVTVGVEAMGVVVAEGAMEVVEEAGGEYF